MSLHDEDGEGESPTVPRRKGKSAAQPLPPKSDADARAHAIERDGKTPEERTAADILLDCRVLYYAALDRIWKGQPHPDHAGAGKALELEARLRGLLDRITDEQLDAALARRAAKGGLRAA